MQLLTFRIVKERSSRLTPVRPAAEHFSSAFVNRSVVASLLSACASVSGEEYPSARCFHCQRPPKNLFGAPRHAHFGGQQFHGDGDEGDRTPDPLLAKQVLSQLSYIPDGALLCFKDRSARTWIRTKDLSFIRAAL